MLEGNRCERCEVVVAEDRAKHKQTKYCVSCAREKKRENSLDPWLPEERREYMRNYMRVYRKTHPRLSSPHQRKHRETRQQHQVGSTYLRCVCVVPVLCLAYLSFGTIDSSFDALRTLITDLELLVVKVTSLVTVVVLCCRHVAHFWRGKEK